MNILRVMLDAICQTPNLIVENMYMSRLSDD